MDETGTVVFATGKAGDAAVARSALLAGILPIASHFSPSYSTACALLLRHRGDLAPCRALVERSFAAYLEAKAAGGAPWDRFEATVRVLEAFGALGDDGAPTEIGRVVAAIRADNELLLALSLLDPAAAAAAGAGAPALAGLLSCFACELGDRPGARVDLAPSPDVLRAVDELWERVLCPLADAHAAAGLGAVRLDESGAGLAEAWAAGADWAVLADATSLDGGDVVRLLRRTLDACRTTAAVAGLPPPIRAAARAAAEAMDRPPVRDDTYDAVFVEDEDAPEGAPGDAPGVPFL